jgi:serine/threonine protein kinase
VTGSDTPRPDQDTHSSPRATKTPGKISRTFGRYRIIRRLGKGGMGTVFLAMDTQLEREVALKIPQFESDDDHELLERFYREARAAATLNHPNLCPVHDVGEVDGIHYLTMAFIEGRSLSDLVRPGEPLAADEAVAIVQKLALGMAEAHEKGIVHRDLKPSNISMNQRGEPVVMDFGLARRNNSDDARLTKSGAVIGTPAYMPPEQIKGDFDAIGPCCDIYSLGVILYELLTGEIPFDGPIAAVLGQVLTQEPPPPSQFRPDLDPRLEAVCLKMMAKDIFDRHQSMADVASDLALSPQAALDAKSKNTSAAGKQKESVPTVTDSKSTQHTQELDQRKKQIESLLEQCEYAPAIDLLEKMAAVKSPKLAKYSRWAHQQLPKAKRGPEEMRESSAAMQRTAADLFDRHDYDQAAEILQQVPKKYRSPEARKLLRECLDLQEEIDVLQADIEQAEAINRYGDLMPTVKRLLQVKPNDRRAKRLLKELKTYGKGGNMRFGGRRDQRFDAAGSTFSPAKAVLFVVIPLVLFGVVSWAIVIYMRSNNQPNKTGNPSAKNPVEDTSDVSDLVADGDPNNMVQGAEKWTSLFNETNHAGWNTAKFNGAGEVTIADGQVILEIGSPFSGVNYVGKIPRINYEVELDAMRVSGNDIFCGLTFPVKKDACSLILGGWGGGVCGLSSIDGLDASENETSNNMKFKNGRWYHVRLRVGADRIQAWIEGKEIIQQDITGRQLTVRSEIEPSKPFGLAAFKTKARFRNLRIRFIKELPFSPTTSADTTVDLFNGRDLTGWSVGYLRYTKDKSPKRWGIDKTAKVLRSVGGDQDHLITDDEFENYTLDLEWRFTRGYKSGPNGTGVIVHSPGTSTELDPDGFEVDLRFAEISALIETRSKIVESGGQGMMGTGCIIAYGESITNHSGSANGLVGENNRRHLDWLEPPKIASIYSWNRLSITAVDDQLLVRINDKLVNKAWNLSRQKGRICLRSQNAAVEFRNVTLKQHSN